MNVNKWLDKNCRNLSGKRVVVTGATGGLGRELCFHLAKLQANITLVCRNQKLAEELANKIKEKYQDVNVDFVELDLSSLRSVDECILRLKQYDGIDVLINNAGVYNVPVKRLDSGFNNVFQINFLYTYYLTKHLLSELEKRENSVCVTVGSIAHNYSKLDENDIDFSSRKKASKIYGNSKRFLMFSLFELFENSKVKLSIVHPGVTLTNMTNHYPKAINWLVKIGIRLLFPNAKKASLSLVYGVCHHTKYHEWIGPKIFGIWGSPKCKQLKTCSLEESKQIYYLAEQMYENLIAKKTKH